MKIAILAALAIFLPFHSCSTHKKMGQNQVPEGHFRLYTYPEEVEKYFFSPQNKERYQEVVFAVINDLDGKVAPNSHAIVDPATNEKLEMKIGGINGYKAYIDILRKRFPHNLQVIASGSLFSSQSSSQKEVNETLFYLNFLELAAAGLSKTDFSLPIKRNYFKTLDHLLEPANFKVLSSNVFSLEEASEFELENILKSAILEAGEVKVGYMSLVSPSMAKTFDSSKLNKVYFQKMAPKIITLANSLRKAGADIVALMVSHGLDCTSQLAHSEQVSEYKVNFTPNNQKVCDLYENELAQTLKTLPPGLVDIVFTNGVDSKAANLVEGYPVLQNYVGGEHLSWAKIVYDTKLKRVAQNKTQIMQPIQLCHSFFKETQDCYVKEVLRNIEIVPAKFLNENVEIAPLPTRK